MKATIFRSVREVHLQYNRFDDNALENISSLNLSEIRVFDISHNQIAKIETLIPISKSSHHLKLLNVSYNKISDLGTNNWTVTLDITNNPIPGTYAAISQSTSNVKVKIIFFANFNFIIFPQSFSNITFSAWNSSVGGQDCGVCECFYNKTEDHVKVNCSKRSLTDVPNIEISVKRNIQHSVVTLKSSYY